MENGPFSTLKFLLENYFVESGYVGRVRLLTRWILYPRSEKPLDEKIQLKARIRNLFLLFFFERLLRTGKIQYINRHQVSHTYHPISLLYSHKPCSHSQSDHLFLRFVALARFFHQLQLRSRGSLIVITFPLGREM
jgi:hypothetical protein